MDGSFAGRQLEAFRGAVLADIVNGLVQDIVFLGVAFAVWQQAMSMRSRHYLNTCILSIDVVYGYPDGYDLCPVHGPVGKILMPGYHFGVARQFAKVMGSDRGKVRTEEILGQIKDLRSGDQVIDPAIYHMGAADRITAFTLRKGIRKKAIKVCSIHRGLFGIEQRYAFQVALLVVGFYLVRRQRFETGVGAGVKRKVFFHRSFSY